MLVGYSIKPTVVLVFAYIHGTGSLNEKRDGESANRFHFAYDDEKGRGLSCIVAITSQAQKQTKYRN